MSAQGRDGISQDRVYLSGWRGTRRRLTAAGQSVPSCGTGSSKRENAYHCHGHGT
jgi:hypothetical protein